MPRDSYDPVAQLAEQLPFKQWVRGSNPRRVTSSEIPTTVPFPALPETALWWEFLRFPPRLAAHPSGCSAGLAAEGDGEGRFSHHRSVSGFTGNCTLMGISSLSAEIRSAGLSADFCKKEPPVELVVPKSFSYARNTIFERREEPLQNQIERNLMG